MRWWIILLAFVIRVYFVFFSGLTWYNTDSWDYLRQADAILSGHPISYFPNGYPLLIAAVKLLFPDPYTALAWLNVILSTLIVWLACEIAEKINANVLLAGLLVALWPNQLNYCRQLLSEVPATFILLAGIALFLNRRYFMAGLLLSIAAMFRSNLVLIIPAYLIVGWYFKLSLRSFFFGSALGLVFYQSLIILRVILPSSVFGPDLLIAITGYSHHLQFSIESFTDYERTHPLQTYFSFALSHPWRFILQRLDSFWELWGFWPIGRRGWIAKTIIGFRFPLLITGSLGAYLNLPWYDWILGLPVLIITITHTVFFANPRYSFVVEPLLVVLASSLRRKCTGEKKLG